MDKDIEHEIVEAEDIARKIHNHARMVLVDYPLLSASQCILIIDNLGKRLYDSFEAERKPVGVPSGSAKGSPW